MFKNNDHDKYKRKYKPREKVSFNGQIINIGLDVHKKNWSASIYVGDKFAKTFQGSTRTILLAHLKTNIHLQLFYSNPFSNFKTPLGQTAEQIPHPTQLALVISWPF